MAEQTKMPFGMWTRVGPGNRVLDGSLELPRGRAILGDIYKLQGICGVSQSYSVGGSSNAVFLCQSCRNLFFNLFL